MDPQSEFASDRFFAKLNEHDHQNGTQTTETIPKSLCFILPVREGRCSEDGGAMGMVTDAKQKARFAAALRLRLLKTHSGTEAADPRHRSIQALDLLFRNLPTELQLSILELLPVPDILNLRLVSRSWHELITMAQVPLARLHLKTSIPQYALRLYPVPPDSQQWFYHLCSLWSRLHVSAKMAHLTCEWVMTEIFLRRTPAQRSEFAAQRERMRRRLIPLLFTIFHFFENYRQLHLDYIQSNPGHPLRWEPYTMNPIEVRIMAQYDNYTLLRVHEAFPLVISTFCRQLRPPTYVGTIERGIRGYLKDKVSDEITSAILCLGGPYQMVRLWEIIGYNHRRSAVDHWFNSLLVDRPRLTQVLSSGSMHTPQQSSPSAPAKPKHKFLGRLGRKKSFAGLRDPAPVSDPMPGVISTIDYNPLTPENDPLYAGRPMAPLTPQQNRSLLGDMPVLQQIWTVTAEALIMERGVVERPEHIKRNGQLLYDLIREPTMADEDEIWYGRDVLEAMRPVRQKTVDIMDVDMGGMC